MTEAPVITRRWPAIGSPALESPEPPVAAFNFPRLRSMADELLQSRRERFPADIAARRISAVDAAREITAFEYLAENWRFIATGLGEPAGFGADHVLREALCEALTRIAEHVADRGGISNTLGAKAESVIALLWHLEPGRRTIALARINQQLRADPRAANNSREPAQ